MKKTFYIKTAFVALLAMTGLSSCLKDESHYVDFAGATPLIELPSAANVGGAGGLFQAVALDISTTPQPFNVPVNLAAPKTLGTDVTVKLSVDVAALNAYNTANGTSYVLLPAADYSSDLTAVIAKGTNLTNCIINIKSNLIDPSTTNYVLPITITDGGGQQISNYKTVLYNVQVKNAYDANYTETGYKFHPTASACRSLSGITARVSTVNGVTSNTAVGDLGGSGYSFNFDVSGTALTNWVVPAGAATPAPPSSGFFTADNPGNVAYAPSTPGQESFRPGIAPYVQTTYNNTYDAANKTFFMHYGYGAGSAGPSGWTRNFYVKLVRQ